MTPLGTNARVIDARRGSLETQNARFVGPDGGLDGRRQTASA